MLDDDEHPGGPGAELEGQLVGHHRRSTTSQQHRRAAPTSGPAHAYFHPAATGPRADHDPGHHTHPSTSIGPERPDGLGDVEVHLRAAADDDPAARDGHRLHAFRLFRCRVTGSSADSLAGSHPLGHG